MSMGGRPAREPSISPKAPLLLAGWGLGPVCTLLTLHHHVRGLHSGGPWLIYRMPERRGWLVLAGPPSGQQWLLGGATTGGVAESPRRAGARLARRGWRPTAKVRAAEGCANCGREEGPWRDSWKDRGPSPKRTKQTKTRSELLVCLVFDRATKRAAGRARPFYLVRPLRGQNCRHRPLRRRCVPHTVFQRRPRPPGDWGVMARAALPERRFDFVEYGPPRRS